MEMIFIISYFTIIISFVLFGISFILASAFVNSIHYSAAKVFEILMYIFAGIVLVAVIVYIVTAQSATLLQEVSE